QCRYNSREALNALKIFDRAKAARCSQRSDNLMLPALIVSGWTEATRGSAFQLDSFQKAIEGEIEIQPGLFAVCDNVQSGGHLVANSDCNRIIDQFSAIIRAKIIEITASKLQPAWKRIAPDDRCAQRMIFHELPSLPIF